MMVISALEDKTFGGFGIISFPFDFLGIIIVAIFFNYWAVASRLPVDPEEVLFLYK